VQTVSENDKDPPAEVVDKPAPIHEYWARVLNVKNSAGQKNYCTLGKVVRDSLSLSHGNADVETWSMIFHKQKVVTPDRVSLDKIQSEEEWLKLETTKAKLKKKEAGDKFYTLQKQRDQKQTEQSNSLKAAEGLLVDAVKRLSEAIKGGDMCQLSVASGLLEVGRKRVAAANRELASIADNRKKMKIDDIW